jgi:chromosomal replication initiation ATPase DnaA
MTKQLPLPFADPPGYAAADFVAARSNQLARDFLARPESWTNGRLVLWGEPGCGKTHLLHIWAAAQGAVFIDGPQFRDFLTPPSGPVAIDDADAAADETALLHLINAAAEAGQPVLLTAQAPPARAEIALPDLASRLRASLAVEISPPDDGLLAALLGRLAADRQLVLNLPVRNFLLSHLPRTPAALREAVARLDKAALAGGGKISRTLAASLLSDLALDLR